LKNYNASLAECSKDAAGADAEKKAAAYIAGNGAFGADPDTAGKFLCSATITGPVVFTPAKDGSDKVIAPVAGTPIVLPGVAANGETAVVATIAYTTQDDTTNGLT